MGMVLWLSIFGLLVANTRAELEFHFRPRDLAQNAEGRREFPTFRQSAGSPTKNVTNATITTGTLVFKFGKQKFDLNTTLSFDDGNTFVFDQSCTEDNQCKKGKPKLTYDTDPSLGGVNTGKPYTYKIPPDGAQMYSGEVYEDFFVLGNITFKTQFGVINKAQAPQELPDVYLGLGYRAKDLGFGDQTEPITKILEGAAENGILIKSSSTPNHGQVIFGALNDSTCLNTIFVDAKPNSANVAQWWIEFKSVQGNKVSITDENQRLARFDLNNPYIVMPTVLARDIGVDPFTDFSRQPDIIFDLGTDKIVVTPQQYAQKQEDGRYKAMVQANDQTPGFVLGTQFMSGRCIVLDAAKKKIGISQLPPSGSGSASVPAVLVVAVSLAFMHLFRF